MKQFKINKNYTNRSEESLDKYLVEINRIPMITPDQEVELAQIIRKDGKKGEEAKNKLVTANLRFVVSVAKQYKVLWPSAQGYGSKYNPYGVEILRHTIGSPWVDEGTTVTFAT